MSIAIPKAELNEFSLPRICVATGQPGPVTFQKVQFQFIPKWVAVFAIAPILYIIFFLLLRKTATGTLPFAEQSWERVKGARRGVAFAGLGFFGGMVLGFALLAQNEEAGLVVLAAAFVGGLVALVVASQRLRKVYPFSTLIDDRQVTLTLPSPEAERLFRQHLHAGARVAP